MFLEAISTYSFPITQRPTVYLPPILFKQHKDQMEHLLLYSINYSKSCHFFFSFLHKWTIIFLHRLVFYLALLLTTGLSSVPKTCQCFFEVPHLPSWTYKHTGTIVLLWSIPVHPTVPKFNVTSTLRPSLTPPT